MKGSSFEPAIHRNQGTCFNSTLRALTAH